MIYDVEWISFTDEYHSEERTNIMQEMYDISSGEEIYHNILEARGNSDDIHIFLDDDHQRN